MAEHDREEVVEVVRDAAGQLADRFHLLRLPVLLLELGLGAQLVAQDGGLAAHRRRSSST